MPKMAHMTSQNDVTQLHVQLMELKIEHQDLGEAIVRLEDAPPLDELLLRRMKKRKLQLKDRITAIERLLGPDLIA